MNWIMAAKCVPFESISTHVEVISEKILDFMHTELLGDVWKTSHHKYRKVLQKNFGDGERDRCFIPQRVWRIRCLPVLDSLK